MPQSRQQKRGLVNHRSPDNSRPINPDEPWRRNTEFLPGWVKGFIYSQALIHACPLQEQLHIMAQLPARIPGKPAKVVCRDPGGSRQLCREGLPPPQNKGGLRGVGSKVREGGRIRQAWQQAGGVGGWGLQGKRGVKCTGSGKGWEEERSQAMGAVALWQAGEGRDWFHAAWPYQRAWEAGPFARRDSAREAASISPSACPGPGTHAGAGGGHARAAVAQWRMTS